MTAKKDKRLLYYIVANILLVSMMVSHTVVYINALRNKSYNEEKTKFVNSVNVINPQATFYLDNSKRIVRDWTKLVSLHDWTADEVIENIGKQNSDSRIMVTVLYADALEGITPSDSDSSTGAKTSIGFEYANY